MPQITSNQWINSVYIKNPNANAVIVKEKQVTIDQETQKVLSVKNNLNYIKNPKRKVYVTKPQFRTHKYKRDYEQLDKVDTYVVEDRYMVDELKKILNLPKYEFMSLRKICNSPYVYNADVSIETLVRTRYEEQKKHDIVPITTGALDIETSLLGCDRINIITFIAEREVYTAVLDDFLWKYVDNKRVKATIDDVYALINTILKPYLDEYKFNIHVTVFENELDLIRWIFSKIHTEEMDFIGIWNMGFDIPKILERIKVYGVDPEDICCHPSVPKEYRICKFAEDKRKVAHIVEKWHWFYCTDKSQFIDSMTLYARIRKSDAKEPYYSLNAISTKEIGKGKLVFQEGSHHEMQQYHFVEYIVYNIVDAMLIQMMEWKNHDITGMYRLTGYSSLSDFSKQTVMLKNKFYKFCLDHGNVYASTGEDMSGPYDDILSKNGGAVLKAGLVKEMGLHAIIERPNIESMIIPIAADFDYKAMYPNFKSAYGLSKETKLLTIVALDNDEPIEPLMGGIADPQNNAVWIGNQYFGLPDYEEWEKIADEAFFHTY